MSLSCTARSFTCYRSSLRMPWQLTKQMLQVFTVVWIGGEAAVRLRILSPTRQMLVAASCSFLLISFEQSMKSKSDARERRTNVFADWLNRGIV